MKNYLFIFTDTVKKKKRKHEEKTPQNNLIKLLNVNPKRNAHKGLVRITHTLSLLSNGPIKFSRYVVIITHETLATLYILFFDEVLFHAQFSCFTSQSDKVIVVFLQGPNTPVQKLLLGETSTVCKNG